MWLLEPTFGYAAPDGSPHRPSPREVLRECLDGVNVRRHPSGGFALAFLVFHLLTGVLLVVSFAFMTWRTLVWGVIVHQVVSLVYQTLWYHRYCAHGAFRFSSPWFARLLLWTNPVVLREETYAIAHRLHHQHPDVAGDPYGPHLGWLGSYFAWESLGKTNPRISPRQYDALKRSLQHVAIPMNDYDAYRRSGSVEQPWHYLGRTIVAQLVFVGTSYAVGGVPCVLSGYGAIFVFTFLLRDFPWRGHGGSSHHVKKPGQGVDQRSLSVNSRFYGYLAAEWHDNHHRLPTSANCALLPGQVDAVFVLIRALHRLGIVASFHDATSLLLRTTAAAAQSPVPAAPLADGTDVFLET